MGPRADLVKKMGPRADVNMNCTLYLQEPVAFGWGLILLFLAVLFLVVCLFVFHVSGRLIVILFFKFLRFPRLLQI